MPTYTPYPTNTPYPTYTPYPTPSPSPTPAATPTPFLYSPPAFQYMFEAVDLRPDLALTNEKEDVSGLEFSPPAFSRIGLQQVSQRLFDDRPSPDSQWSTALTQWLSVYTAPEDAKAAFYEVVDAAARFADRDLEESQVDLGDRAIYVSFWSSLAARRFKVIVVQTGNILDKVQIRSSSDTVLKSTALRWMQTAQEKLAAKSN
jgi:hypothetical protein